MVKFSSQQKDLLELRQHRAIEAGERFMIVALEDNLQWVESELTEFLTLINEGHSFESIASHLNRPAHEVYYLAAYLSASCNQHAKQALAQKAKRLFRLQKNIKRKEATV